MSSAKRLVSATVVLLAAGQAAGSNPPPIATDRPSVTASSAVVPPGSLQFENGVAGTAVAGQEIVDGPETLVRFGVASDTELRLTAPNYNRQIAAGSGEISGFGDPAIGVKRHLGAAGGFDASLMASLSLPSGADAVSSHGYDPSVQLPWSKTLSSHWTAAGMLSVYWPTVSGRRNVTGETTFLFDRQVTKRCDTFVEYAGDFAQRGGPRHLVHFGAAYRPTARQQLDFHAGIGVSAAAPDHFIGAGYFFRLQAAQRGNRK